MYVIQVTPRYPPHTGGVETHIREISERLVERGHDVTVLSADAGGDVARRETRNGVDVRRFRGFAPGGAFHVAPGLVRTVRDANADIVHAHNYHSLPAFFAALGVGEARFIVTPHYHGTSASSVRDRLLSLYQPLGGWMLRRADAVVAVSEWERERLHADFGVDATVIPNGLDINRFRNATPEERYRPYLLTVGRLEEYKGVQHVIRALSELPNYALLVAGSGPYREELQQAARNACVADRVEFLGFVDDDRLPSLYAGAAAYVTLSKFEAYGMTVGEALAAGTPCVVRSTGALTDWTDHEGVVGVTDISPNTVTNAIYKAVRQGVDTDLSTWKDVTSRLVAIYKA